MWRSLVSGIPVRPQSHAKTLDERVPGIKPRSPESKYLALTFAAGTCAVAYRAWALPRPQGASDFAQFKGTMMLVPTVPISFSERLLGPRKLMYFVHTPKCGGTFVDGHFHKWRVRCPTMTLPATRGRHLTYLEFKRAFREYGLDIDDGYTFSVVRNPWDWHVSFYHYIKGDRGGRQSGHLFEYELFQRLSFKDYLKWLDDPTTRRTPHGYLSRPVSDWVVDEAGNIAVDRILKQETLEADLGAMVGQLKLAVTVRAERPNTSSREADYRTYYDTQSAELVGRRHQRDLELFGYSF